MHILFCASQIINKITDEITELYIIPHIYFPSASKKIIELLLPLSHNLQPLYLISSSP